MQPKYSTNPCSRLLFQAEIKRINERISERLNETRSKKVKRETSPVKASEIIDIDDSSSGDNNDSIHANRIPVSAKPNRTLDNEVIILDSD
jgi:flagellar biosynthesis regulator FlbT